MSLSIRAARPPDAGLILALVRDLADYEMPAHEAQARGEMTAAALFDAHPAADGHAPSIAFYRSLGAVLQPEWKLCRLAGGAPGELARTGA